MTSMLDKVNIDSLGRQGFPDFIRAGSHSVYISAKDVQAANDDLKGSFSGVGIEFNSSRHDTRTKCYQERTS